MMPTSRKSPHRFRGNWMHFFIALFLLIGGIIYLLSFELVKRDYFFKVDPINETISQK